MTNNALTPNSNETGKRISEFLNSRSLSQRDLAKRIGCTSQLISMIVTGRSNLTYDRARIIEIEYGVSANWLLTGEGPKMAYKTTSNKMQKFNECMKIFKSTAEVINILTDTMEINDWMALENFCSRVLTKYDSQNATIN